MRSTASFPYYDVMIWCYVSIYDSIQKFLCLVLIILSKKVLFHGDRKRLCHLSLKYNWLCCFLVTIWSPSEKQHLNGLSVNRLRLEKIKNLYLFYIPRKKIVQPTLVVKRILTTLLDHFSSTQITINTFHYFHVFPGKFSNYMLIPFLYQ